MRDIAACLTEELIPLAETLLEVPQGLIHTALDLELQEGTVVADRVGERPCIFLAGLHRAERTMPERLIGDRLAARCPGPGLIRTRRYRGSRSVSSSPR